MLLKHFTACIVKRSSSALNTPDCKLVVCKTRSPPSSLHRQTCLLYRTLNLHGCLRDISARTTRRAIRHFKGRFGNSSWRSCTPTRSGVRIMGSVSHRRWLTSFGACISLLSEHWPLTVCLCSETNILAMRLGKGKHLEGRTLMGGIVKPEEFDHFHEACTPYKSPRLVYVLLTIPAAHNQLRTRPSGDPRIRRRPPRWECHWSPTGS